MSARSHLRRVGAVVLLLAAFEAGSLASPKPAQAFGLDTGAIVGAIVAMKNLLNGAIGEAQKAINGTLGTINGSLGGGFTQLSNYMKAQVGAQEQIADANNLVQARLARDVRNAAVRDNHSVNRQDCLNLESGQAAVVAARNATVVAAALDAGKDQRGQGAKGTPSWAGAAQAGEANNEYHKSTYCDDAEAEAGLCTLVSKDLRDADQRVDSLLLPPVYADQDAIKHANDYAMSLIQPVAPPALRGKALSSVAGQDTLPQRRRYNAAISLATRIVDGVLSWHAGTVTLTDAQKSEASREGISSTATGSQWEATELEVNRKYAGTDWQADLQGMPGEKAVLVQIALLDAQRNWLLWQQLKLDQERALSEAARLAYVADVHRPGLSPVPGPAD